MYTFNKAQNAIERMEMLKSLVKHFAGDFWKVDFGISEKELSKYKLAYLLKMLYSFVGKIPPANPEYNYADSAFFNSRTFKALKYMDDGRIIF